MGIFLWDCCYRWICSCFLILIIFFVKNKPVKKGTGPVPWKYYSKTIIVYGFIAALSHMILLIIQFADSFTVVPGLIESGLSDQEAMEEKVYLIGGSH